MTVSLKGLQKTYVTYSYSLSQITGYTFIGYGFYNREGYTSKFDFTMNS